MSRFGLSMRRTCALVGLNRSTSQYKPTLREDEALTTRMKELAVTHKRYGSPRLHVLLKKEGLVINHKRTERIYRREGLSLTRRHTKKRVFPVRGVMDPTKGPRDVWSCDFVSDSLSNGRRFRILTIIDDYTRESPGMAVDRSIPSRRVTAFIDEIARYNGYPKHIRADNGPEFTSAHFHAWAAQRNITLWHTRPGKPSDNAFIESFNGKLRDECLNIHWFLSIAHAQSTIEQWRTVYNKERPHSSLNNLTPYEFVKEHGMTQNNQVLNLKVAHITG